MISKVDKTFLIIVIIILIMGVIMFTSASLGILAKSVPKFYSVLFGQFVFGLLLGLIALYLCSRIPYKFWRNYSLIILIFSILLTALTLIPSMSISHGGASRWLKILGYSFQPVEILKISFIIYLSAWLSWVKWKITDLKYSILPLVILLGIMAAILLNQPDTKSLILMTATATIILFVSGLPWKYILGIILVCAISFSVLIYFKPYLTERVKTFFNPSRDNTGASYQLNQSFLALGGGGLVGRGLGQSIQKFGYLPEPQGDSIFSVIGEELGFIGAVFLILLYTAFILRGFKIAMNSPDSFSRNLVVGIVSIITLQSFMNIASMIGVFPLTGVPLVFISHGGTALFLSLAMVGIVLNISRFQKKNQS